MRAPGCVAARTDAARPARRVSQAVAAEKSRSGSSGHTWEGRGVAPEGGAPGRQHERRAFQVSVGLGAGGGGQSCVTARSAHLPTLMWRSQRNCTARAGETDTV